MKHIFFSLLALSMLSFSSKIDDEISLSQKQYNHNNIALNETSSEHKYYVSVSNIKYNAEAKSLQMTTRFFIDDFEDILSAREEREISLGDPLGLKDLKPVITGYLLNKLRIKTDDVSQDIDFLGAEYEADQIILYIEIPVEQQPREIEMSFTAFFELFEDQKNLVHCKIDDKRKTLLMHVNKKTDSVKF